MAAFEAGANVLVSKPLAMNLAEAEEMVAAAKRCGKLMSMGLQNRSKPEVQALRQCLAEGKLGNVYHTRLWHGHVMHIPGTPTMYKRHLAGGGVLIPYNRPSARRDSLGVGKSETGARLGGELPESAQDEDSTHHMAGIGGGLRHRRLQCRSGTLCRWVNDDGGK